MTIRIGNPRVTVNTTFTTSSSDLSNAVDLGGYRLAALVFPSSWTAGSLTFQASVDNSTFRELYDSTGGAVAVTGGDGITVAIGSAQVDILGACQYIKLRSGTTALGVSQTTARTVMAVLAPL